MKAFLYMHGGSGNHGCEAIVRTLHEMIKNEFEQVVLFSKRAEEDKKYLSDLDIKIIQTGGPLGKDNIRGFISSFRVKYLKQKLAYVKPAFRNLIKAASKDAIAFSIGGDNYCYDGVPDVLAMLNSELNRRGCKTVLYGCSIEPSLLQEKTIIEDLNRYKLITTRETITYNALLSSGVKTTVALVNDPAFTLQAVYEPLPDGFSEKQTVGINISPLILSYDSGNNVLFSAYKEMIEHIINTTNYQIALISHVVWENNNDMALNRKLFESFKSCGRVFVVDDSNTCVLKGYISRCKFFIGARTHATIAAYSTCVPTIVVGYSVKSLGIAKDIFGTHENYVIPADEIKDSKALCRAFDWMAEEENNIKNHLEDVMPQYIENAYLDQKHFSNLLK